MILTKAVEFFLMGAVLGLSAGISPGPLLTLVISQTIKHNRLEGIKIALSPLITDLPIILLTVLVFTKLAQFNTLLGIISLAGGIFVAYLGYESISAKELTVNSSSSGADSLRKGIATNFLSPHPYLFWITIGTPLLFKALNISTFTVITFFAGFYLMLIGSKMTVALLVAGSKKFLRQNSYLLIMRALGVVLLLFSLLFFYDGFKYLLKQ